MDEIQSVARKITTVLFTQQALASAGFIASATVSSIVGKELSHHADWAGMPSAVYQLGVAFAAFAWGYAFDAFGRRGGLVLGLSVGALGSGIACYAISQSSFIIFLAGLVLMGAANAAVQLGRFAAAEVNLPEQRGRAISNVVIGGTVGSILGPFIAGGSSEYIASMLGSELASAYFIAMILFAVGVLVVYFGLRPDPRDIGRELAKKYPEAASIEGRTRSALEIFRQPAAQVALLSMTLGQMVMVFVMVITSLHMKENHHSLFDISAVVSAHTFGMYAFSILSGRLSDRLGRGPVIIIGAATLILSCLAATVSPDVLPLGFALFLLGLGWNFCFVGGSTLLADQLSPTERARTQGLNDLIVGLASALGSLGSGIIFASLGYNTMAYVSAVIAFIPLLAASFWTRQRARVSPS